MTRRLVPWAWLGLALSCNSLLGNEDPTRIDPPNGGEAGSRNQAGTPNNEGELRREPAANPAPAALYRIRWAGKRVKPRRAAAKPAPAARPSSLRTAAQQGPSIFRAKRRK